MPGTDTVPDSDAHRFSLVALTTRRIDLPSFWVVFPPSAIAGATTSACG